MLIRNHLVLAVKYKDPGLITWLIDHINSD